MKKLIFIIFLVCVVMSSCGSRKKALAQWSSAADSMTFVLIDQFMDKDKGTFWGSAGDTLQNSRFLYWQQAHAMDVVINSYNRIKDSDPERAAEYEEYFKRWYANKANNWDIWSPPANEPTGFYNEFTDDMGWIVITLFNLSEATGNEEYYETGKYVYDNYMVPRGWEDEHGWGMPWKLGDDDKARQRNGCTNGPAGIIACRIYQKNGEQKYLDEAIKLRDMLANTYVPGGGAAADPALTYTQGTWMELNRLLYHITGDKKYLDEAELTANFTMYAPNCLKDGILRDEGGGNDNSFFKAVFVHYAAIMANDKAVSRETRKNIKEFLTLNAETLLKNLDRSLYPKMFANYYWGEIYNEAGNPGSLGAQTSGAALFEAMTRIY